jgi:hypothetical protein
VTGALTREHFAPHSGSLFCLRREDGFPVTLELIEVSEVRTTSRSEAFSIVFRGPLDVPLPQATYDIQHDTLGSFDLFIVPIRRDQQGFFYEAVFNRLRSEDLP